MAINLDISDNRERIPLSVQSNTRLRSVNADNGSPYYVGARAYVTQTENGAVVTVIDKEGTTIATINNGEQGIQGETGNGIASAILNADYTLTLLFTDGTSVTTASIRGEQGEQGIQGERGEKGDKGDAGDVSIAQLQDALVKGTASGSIASFTDGAENIPVVDLVADIEPIQNGSGTTSPTNIRPISGWTSISVTVSPTTSASDGTTTTIPLGRTVYSGTLDVTTGLLTVTWGKVLLGERTWSYNSGGYFYASISTGLPKKAGNSNLICDTYFTTQNTSVGTMENFSIKGNANTTNIYIKDSNYTDAASFVSARGNAEIVYELAEPQTYQLDAQQIATLLGTNNIWANSGAVEVTYCADSEDVFGRKYTFPTGGIPKTDLASAVQTSLGKADTALQSYTETDPVFTASAAYGISASDITNWNNKSNFSGSYNDLTNKPTIPSAVTESTVSGWGFTKNTGTYSKPNGGIPKTDLASAVQTSLGKADTALQSFTETDPTVPSWAKASSKPTYTASEVGAVPTTRTVNGKALSSNITLTASDVSALPSSTVIPTYTAGTGIDITNGVISIDLDSAEGSDY